MTYSLVSAGTVASTATTGTFNATCASTTAHNLLIAIVGLAASTSNVTTLPAGWVRAVLLGVSNAAESSIWYYPDCPAGITSVGITWTASSAAMGAAQILEFHDSAGTSTSPLDVTGSSSGASSPLAIATGSATTAAGELAVATFTGWYASATKDTISPGAGFTSAGNYGNGVKQVGHVEFDYNLNTGAAGVQTDSVTFTGPFTGHSAAIATFKIYTPPVSPPSVVVYKDAYQFLPATITYDLVSRTVATGDVVAVVVNTEDWGAFHLSTLAKLAGTATIGTVTLQREAGSGSHCGLALATFTVTTGGSLQLRVTWNSTPAATNHATVWTYVATGCGGVGNTAMTTTSSTTVTASLATSANSYVLALAADWSALGGATTTLTPAGGVLDAHETDGVVDQVANGTVMSSRGGHWASVSAGTVSYGVNVPTSSQYDLVVCELLGGAGAPAGLLPQQVRMRHPAYWTRIASPASSGAVYTR